MMLAQDLRAPTFLAANHWGDWPLGIHDLESQFGLRAVERDIPVTVEDFRIWLEGLRTIPGGELCLQSFWEEGQLSIDIKVEILLSAVFGYKEELLNTSGASKNAAYYCLATACQRFPDFGADIYDSVGELARFVDFEQASARHFPRRGGYAVNTSFDEVIWKDEISGDEIIRDDRLRSLQGRIRGGGDVNLFSTLAAWVTGQGVTGPELAERVRDGLGLPHLEGKDVLEIRLQEDVVRRHGVLKKPTFADAGGYPPFLPSRAGDNYGYARDISSPDLSKRGGPEIWHGDLPAREISGLRRLGPSPNHLKTPFWRLYNQWWSVHR